MQDQIVVDSFVESSFQAQPVILELGLQVEHDGFIDPLTGAQGEDEVWLDFGAGQVLCGLDDVDCVAEPLELGQRSLELEFVSNYGKGTFRAGEAG